MVPALKDRGKGGCFGRGPEAGTDHGPTFEMGFMARLIGKSLVPAGSAFWLAIPMERPTSDHKLEKKEFVQKRRSERGNEDCRSKGLPC